MQTSRNTYRWTKDPSILDIDLTFVWKNDVLEAVSGYTELWILATVQPNETGNPRKHHRCQISNLSLCSGDRNYIGKIILQLVSMNQRNKVTHTETHIHVYEADHEIFFYVRAQVVIGTILCLMSDILKNQ